MHIYDGQPHPSTGNPNYDASAYTQVDANTLSLARFKAGKLIAVGSIVKIARRQDGDQQHHRSWERAGFWDQYRGVRQAVGHRKYLRAAKGQLRQLD
jgi:hypothetical protein